MEGVELLDLAFRKKSVVQGAEWTCWTDVEVGGGWKEGVCGEVERWVGGANKATATSLVSGKHRA